ncbi:putative Peptidase M3A/M3B catalytic domain-containing protein [Seiridium unicorne]|uniref:Peptidase M3A/M3B catalytic domain-containing protein n=1 Tax=Seiridium unicorne TaxID=138068 RepID=A0ABR2VG49_9PEZI
MWSVRVPTACTDHVVRAGKPRHMTVTLLKSIGASQVFNYNDPNVIKKILNAMDGKTAAGAIAIGDNSAFRCLDVLGHCKGDKHVAMATFPIPAQPKRFALLQIVFYSVTSMISIAIKSRLRGIKTSFVGGTVAHSPVGDALYVNFLPEALANGKFRAAPEPMVVGQGLEPIQEALELQKKGVSARKIVSSDTTPARIVALIAGYENTIDAVVRNTTLENATFDTVVRPWVDTDNAMQAPAGWKSTSCAANTSAALDKKAAASGLMSKSWMEDELAKWGIDDSLPDRPRRFVPFANGGSQEVVKYAHSSEVRRRMFFQNDKKPVQNELILEETIRRHCTQAQILGLPNHAAFRAKGRAVKSAEWIKEFPRNVDGRLVDHAKKEVAELQQLRIEDRKQREVLQKGDEKAFPAWEQQYYINLMEKAVDLDEEKISEYFPVEQVMVLPPGICKLLKHVEVVAVFHELGHALHDLLSKTTYVAFRGSNRLPVDIGEMPSKYLTKWQIDNPGQPDPPRTIPKELVQALQRSQWLDQGLFYNRQAMVSTFDMAVHSIKSPDDVPDMRQLWYSLQEELEGRDFTDIKSDGSAFTTFAHLVSRYDAGYYGYSASDVSSCAAFAQDIWRSKFAEYPRDRLTWELYHHMILEYGGAHPHKLHMLKDFLVREPNGDTLVESLELGAVE